MDKKSYFETAFVHFILKKQYEKKIDYVVVKTGHTDYSLKISDRHASKKIDPVPEYSLEELEELVRRAYYYNYNNPVHNEIVKYWESEKGVPKMTIISSLLEFHPSSFTFDLELYTENSRYNSYSDFVSGYNMLQDIDSEIDFWLSLYDCEYYFMEHENDENYALFMSFVNQAKEIMISTTKEVCDIFKKRGSPFWKVDLVSLNECAEHFGIHHREKREHSKDMDIFDACEIYAHALHEKKDITDKVSIDKFIKALKLLKYASPDILFNNLVLIRPEHVSSLDELTDLSFEETNDCYNNRKTVAVNFIRNAFLCGYSENEISHYMDVQPFFSSLDQFYFRDSKPYQTNSFSLSEFISLEKVKLDKEFSDLFRKKFDISFDENGSLCVFCPYNIYEEKVEKMKKKWHKMTLEFKRISEEERVWVEYESKIALSRNGKSIESSSLNEEESKLAEKKKNLTKRKKASALYKKLSSGAPTNKKKAGKGL